MNELKEETIEIPKSEPPTDAELLEHMTELEQRGVPVEIECFECDGTTELPVLPVEGDENHKTLCQPCAIEHLREQGML